MISLRGSLVELLSKAFNDTIIFTTPQMKEFFKLGLLAIRQTKKVTSTPEKLPTIWQPATWDTLCVQLATSRFTASAALETMCKKMSSEISVTPTKSNTAEAAPKRKAEEAMAPTETKRKKAKKDNV